MNTQQKEAQYLNEKRRQKNIHERDKQQREAASTLYRNNLLGLDKDATAIDIKLAKQKKQAERRLVITSGLGLDKDATNYDIQVAKQKRKAQKKKA